MKSTIVAAAVAAALLPAAASASPADVHETVLFWAVDRNGDGAIERAESDTLRGVVFDAIDTNRDGRVSPAEVGLLLVPADPEAKEKAVEKANRKRGQMLARLNLDKPEGVPRDEFLDRGAALFVKADANGDGAIDPAEFTILIADLGVLLPR